MLKLIFLFNLGFFLLPSSSPSGSSRKRRAFSTIDLRLFEFFHANKLARVHFLFSIFVVHSAFPFSTLSYRLLLPYPYSPSQKAEGESPSEVKENLLSSYLAALLSLSHSFLTLPLPSFSILFLVFIFLFFFCFTIKSIRM